MYINKKVQRIPIFFCRVERNGSSQDVPNERQTPPLRNPKIIIVNNYNAST